MTETGNGSPPGRCPKCGDPAESRYEIVFRDAVAGFCRECYWDVEIYLALAGG